MCYLWVSSFNINNQKQLYVLAYVKTAEP